MVAVPVELLERSLRAVNGELDRLRKHNIATKHVHGPEWGLGWYQCLADDLADCLNRT